MLYLFQLPSSILNTTAEMENDWILMNSALNAAAKPFVPAPKVCFLHHLNMYQIISIQLN